MAILTATKASWPLAAISTSPRVARNVFTSFLDTKSSSAINILMPFHQIDLYVRV